jgi:hypothetical protein
LTRQVLLGPARDLSNADRRGKPLHHWIDFNQNDHSIVCDTLLMSLVLGASSLTSITIVPFAFICFILHRRRIRNTQSHEQDSIRAPTIWLALMSVRACT